MASSRVVICAIAVAGVATNPGCAICEDVEALPARGTLVRSLTVGDGCALPRSVVLRHYLIAQEVRGVEETQLARASGQRLSDVTIDTTGEVSLALAPDTYLFCVDEPRLTFAQASCVAATVSDLPALVLVLETEGGTRLSFHRAGERSEGSEWLMATFLDTCLEAGTAESMCSGASTLGPESCLAAALAIAEDDCARLEGEALADAFECRATSPDCDSLSSCPSVPCAV